MSEKKPEDNWTRMSFKGNKVWVATDKNRNILVEKGKVLIKYNLKQDYEYRVKPENLRPEDQAVPSRKKSGNSSEIKTGPESSSQSQKEEHNLPDNCIRIYTDGASSGNPGPSGIGILFLWEDKKRQVSEYIGTATNNIAELTAIKVALQELKRTDLPVRIFTDSGYSMGLLTKDWKPAKNKELVLTIRELMKKFADIALIKVKGHSGIKENEVADFLATSAIKKSLQ